MNEKTEAEIKKLRKKLAKSEEKYTSIYCSWLNRNDKVRELVQARDALKAENAKLRKELQALKKE